MAALGAPAPTDQESVGGLVSRLGTDLTRIVRAELALSQVRLAAALDVLKVSGGWLGLGVLIALAGVGVLTVGLVALLARQLPLWLAALVVGGFLALVAAALIVVQGRKLTDGVREALTFTEHPER